MATSLCPTPNDLKYLQLYRNEVNSSVLLCLFLTTKMSEDLLAKEREFHRLNRELGRKTKDLMREVDSVLISHSTNFFPTSTRVNETLQTDYYRNEPSVSYAKKSKTVVNSETPSANSEGGELENLSVEEIVSNDAEHSRNDAFVRFLKAKTKLLHDEVQTIRAEYKKKCNYCKELEAENKKLEDAKIKIHNQTASLKDTIVKLETTNGSLQTEVQARGNEIAGLKKEIDALRSELKAANLQSHNFDVRLNRSLEENARLRNVVKSNKIEEKELRDQIRRLQEGERLSTKNLERQRAEILQAFKKQTSLVDNLKRQKAYLEASRMVQLTEEEFSKLLDWSPENT